MVSQNWANYALSMHLETASQLVWTLGVLEWDAACETCISAGAMAYLDWWIVSGMGCKQHDLNGHGNIEGSFFQRIVAFKQIRTSFSWHRYKFWWCWRAISVPKIFQRSLLLLPAYLHCPLSPAFFGKKKVKAIWQGTTYSSEVLDKASSTTYSSKVCTF